MTLQGRSSEVVDFDIIKSAYESSYWSSIVTLILSCRCPVSETLACIRRSLSALVFQSVVASLVLSRLDYCNAVGYECVLCYSRSDHVTSPPHLVYSPERTYSVQAGAGSFPVFMWTCSSLFVWCPIIQLPIYGTPSTSSSLGIDIGCCSFFDLPPSCWWSCCISDVMTTLY